MLPNFLVIGAAKSGTTSLYHHLASHPAVFMSPVKETNFFALEGRDIPPGQLSNPERGSSGLVRTLTEYETLFEGVDGESAIGEASPWYLHSDQAPTRIHHHVPACRLIAILRHPADRAYSAYLANRRDGIEPMNSFEGALEEQAGRQRRWNWGLEFLHGGYYHRHLSRYYELFPAEQIRVYLFRDLVARPEWLLSDLFTFLGVDSGHEPPGLTTRHNPSKRSVGDVLGRVGLSRRPPRLAPTPMQPETRARLRELYRDDITALSDLIERDLTRWLEG